MTSETAENIGTEHGAPAAVGQPSQATYAEKTSAPQASGEKTDADDKPTASDTGGVAKPKSDAPPATAEKDENESCQAKLDLTINDWHGDPIPRLGFKVFVKDKEVFAGQTDGKGSAAIEGLDVGDKFEIRVKRDNGEFKFAAIGNTMAENNIACLKSPRVRFAFSTSPNEGAPGGADRHKEAVLRDHTQTAENTPNISRNPDKPPQAKADRNGDGLPKATVLDGLKNIVGRNSNYASSPNAGQPDLEKVKRLIEFATMQVTQKHKDMTSQAIIDKMKVSSYQYARPKEGFGHSVPKEDKGQCTKYVKIALWYAGYSHNNGDIAPAVSPARLMGPELVKAGFKDITAILPDARWAAPGDIIVYRKIGDPDAVGHIDIRTYDGYVSDFVETYLPTSGYEVIGIYRKYYDPLPDKRVRAFLKVLRSREAGSAIARFGEQAAYQALPDPGIKGQEPPLFSSFAKHPFAGKGGKFTASGAYGILLSSWTRYVVDPPRWTPVGDTEPLFSPLVQDRIAVAMMEMHPDVGYTKTDGVTALGLIRKGEIEAGANLLAVGGKYPQFPSLPGGKQSHDYTVVKMMDAFNRYFQELK